MFAPLNQIQISVHTSVPFGFKCTILYCDLPAICPAWCRRRLKHPSRFFPLLLRLRGHVSPPPSLPHSCSFPHFFPFPRLLPILTRGKGRREGRSFPSLALTVPKARYSPSSPPFPPIFLSSGVLVLLHLGQRQAVASSSVRPTSSHSSSLLLGLSPIIPSPYLCPSVSVLFLPPFSSPPPHACVVRSSFEKSLLCSGPGQPGDTFMPRREEKRTFSPPR